MAAKKIDFFAREIHIFEKIEDLFEARGNQIIPTVRKIADKQLEGGAGVEAGLQIARGHSQFVEVGQKPRVLTHWPCIAQWVEGCCRRVHVSLIRRIRTKRRNPQAAASRTMRAVPWGLVNSPFGDLCAGNPYFRTASLKALAARSRTTVFALILIASPVAGLRPMRALR